MKPRYLAPPAIFAASLAYAVVRYVVLKGVPVAHFPLFIVNKAVAMTALGMLGLAVAGTCAESRRRAARAAVGAAVLHALLSFAILTPAYFPEFYSSAEESAGFTLGAEAALLAGILGFVTMAGVGRRNKEGVSEGPGGWDSAAAGALALAALHCLLAGWPRWWKPLDWPGGLPPITLLSFLYVVGVALVRIRRGRSAAAGDKGR